MGNLLSNPSSSTQTAEKKYEVFLNFRGVDTRHGFTNYLYEALLRKSIETFRDEEKIPKGDQIGPTLLKAIRESKISVVIFSKEYASSKWCLHELVEIMECEKKSGQIVIPVFYKVDVHDVRHQQGSFKDGFDQLEKTFEENFEKEQVDSADVEKRKKEFYEEMQKWRQALEVASRLKGWRLEGPESEFIDEIVKDIWEKLMRAYKLSPCDFKGLFGFEKRFKQVMSLLSIDDADIRIIGIWGMGGIGKTTIADAIFHQISYDKYSKCFIQNVRQRLEQYGGLVNELKQEVLSKVLDGEDIELDGVTLPKHIKKRLRQKKVFIVLDDVDDFLKLQELAAGLDGLGLGSRIIITTRRRDILKMCEVNDDYIYEVKGLSNQEAHQFFCQYAFGHNPPAIDLMSLSHETLWAINGNPLGLKVAGSLLLGLNKLEWQSALNRIKKSPEILDVLQTSYNRLAQEDKDTFLDIACFFVGEHEDYVVKILDNCHYSIKVLSDRSLITISDRKIIQMHDLLQEMGREIVCKEDLNNPGNRSRLWTQKDVLDTLKNGDGTNALRGIFLNMSGMNEEHLGYKAFKKMKNLRFIKFYDSTFYELTKSRSKPDRSKILFPNDISYLSNNLWSLNWLRCPLKALPSNFIPHELVELDLRYSNIEKLWEGNKYAPKLKWVILKACPYLIKVSDGLVTPLLEKIDIEYCDSFLGFPSRNHFPSLTYLHLNSCNKLTRISDLLDAPKLKRIFLEACPYLIKVSDSLNAPLLEKIDIECCDSFLGFPSHNHFPSLTYLHLKSCNKLTRISDLLDAPKLKQIILEACPYLIKVSEGLDAPLLEKIDIEYCDSFLGFPSHNHFPSLTYLHLKSCNKLTRISDLLDASIPSCNHFPSLTYLHLKSCNKLTRISDLLDAPKLKQIMLEACPYLIKISDNLDAPLLEKIDIENCDSFLGFSSHNRFPSLRYLHLKSCNKLTSISDLLNAPLLEEIDIEYCISFFSFPSTIHHFINLHELNMWDCKNLQSIPNIVSFPSLVYLNLSGCINLARISDFLDTPLVKKINLYGCKSLLDFPPPLHHFNNLHKLILKECKNLQSFPNNISFPSLLSLDLSGCINLVKISDFLDAPLLEKIDLYNCKSLLDFPPLVQCFNKLRELNVRDCEKLQSFAKNIHFPSLISLDVSGCHSLTEFSGLLDAPLLETINLKDCSSLVYFPAPFHHFNNICNLEPWGCKNLWSFLSNNIYFPSRTCLDFHGCVNLTKFPHISGNIKSLCMRMTGIDEVPSSIENLTELVELDLAECTRLKHISTSIRKLKALRELNLSNCSTLECFPEISDAMGSLKILVLSGTAIKGLHHSIENLSGLKMLFLRECKNFEMLPISICKLTSLNILDLSGCSKLENLLGNSVTNLTNYGESATTKSPIGIPRKCKLDFINCLNLNKTAVINFMELQINQHRDMIIKGCGIQVVDLKFYYPGSEVPGWFKHQTVGSLINIQMSSHDGVNGHLIGLAACAVIKFYGKDYDFKRSTMVINYCHRCLCMDSRRWIKRIEVSYKDETFRDYVALWYSDASVLKLCKNACPSYCFEFFLFNTSPIGRLIYCGVCPIYEKHNITLPSIANETYGAADQDFGEMSVKEQGKVRKFSDEAETSGKFNEDVIEPNPKRTCS